MWMKDALDGKDSLKVSYDTAVGVLVAQPPFPEPANPEKLEDVPIYGLEDIWEQFSPWQILLSKSPEMIKGAVKEVDGYMTTGTYIGVVTGKGKTVKSAAESAYSAIDQIHLRSMMVRNDVGEKIIKQLPELHKFGYALEMNP